MADLEAFRNEARSWLEANYPPSLKTPMTEDEAPWGGRKAVYKNPDIKLWMDRMASRGWTAPTWPKEYGGGGLTGEPSTGLKGRNGWRRPRAPRRGRRSIAPGWSRR